MSTRLAAVLLRHWRDSSCALSSVVPIGISFRSRNQVWGKSNHRLSVPSAVARVIVADKQGLPTENFVYLGLVGSKYGAAATSVQAPN